MLKSDLISVLELALKEAIEVIEYYMAKDLQITGIIDEEVQKQLTVLNRALALSKKYSEQSRPLILKN